METIRKDQVEMLEINIVTEIKNYLMGSSAEEKNPWTWKYVKEITQTKTQREIEVENQTPPPKSRVAESYFTAPNINIIRIPEVGLLKNTSIDVFRKNIQQNLMSIHNKSLNKVRIDGTSLTGKGTF